MTRRGPRTRDWFAKIQIGRSRPSRPGIQELHDLEALTSASVQQWHAIARADTDYHYAQYYELESQRAARHSEICAALRDTGAIPVELDGWFRAVNFKYGFEGLSPAGSLTWVGGRFNTGRDVDPSRFPPFPALYLAEDFETAYREYFQLPSDDRSRGLAPEELALDEMGSWVALKVKGSVKQVFDLTRSKNLQGFCQILSKFTLSQRVREAETKSGRPPTRLARRPAEFLAAIMHENWNAIPVHFGLPSNSQIFARLLIESGYEGVLYRSSKHEKCCLAVFTRQLVKSDSAIYLHPDHPSDIRFREIGAANCLDV